jgi:hypothetical protein
MDTVLSNEDGVLIYTGAPSATDEILAFHYGNFDDAYGDGTVGAAAANGRVYANTGPGDLPAKFGSIGTPSTASGQTTYTWTPPATSLQANVLLVAGGGGGGSDNAGGGGGGGVIFQTGVAISGAQTIKVGKGGVGPFTNQSATNGSNSEMLGSIAIGGGRGGTGNTGMLNGSAGGSGGGGASEGTDGTGGAGTSEQGNSGGNGFASSGGGGGGAGTPGTDGVAVNNAGSGGTGVLMSVFGEIYGENGWFAGGGGGGVDNETAALAGTGIGGIGGGGDGGGGTSAESGTGKPGIPHTGGGGGGANYPNPDVYGGDGGSGVVLVRYIVDTTVIMTRIDSMNFLPQLQGVSGAVTLTGVQEDTALTFNNKRKCVLVASVAIDQNTEGIIYEAGATGAGFALYATGGTLYCQGGNGGSVAGSVELSYPIPSYFSRNTPTEIGISVEVLASTSRMRMFVNTQQVAQTSTNMGYSAIAGPNPAGSGQVYDSLAMCRISSAQATYTDTIYTVNLYPNVYIE